MLNVMVNFDVPWDQLKDVTFLFYFWMWNIFKARFLPTF